MSGAAPLKQKFELAFAKIPRLIFLFSVLAQERESLLAFFLVPPQGRDDCGADEFRIPVANLEQFTGAVMMIHVKRVM